MRITPKKFKEYVDRNLPGITDQELFTSEYLRARLEQMATAITGRYRRPVKVLLVWNASAPQLAYTDNNSITINVGNEDLKTKNRNDKYRLIVGFLAHETAHILYTDFIEKHKFLNGLNRGQWYPQRPVFKRGKYERRLEEIESAFTANAASLCNIANVLRNTFEDEVIEQRMKHEYPGSFKEGLSYVGCYLAKISSSIIDLCQSDQELCIRINLIFHYARLGTRDFQEAGSRRERWIKICTPYMDKAVNGNALERFDAVNHLLVLLWPYIDLTQGQEPPPMRAETADPNGFSSPVESQERQDAETEEIEGTNAEHLPELANTALAAILRQIAEERAKHEIERELRRELDTELQRMDLGEMHEITSHIFRKDQVDPELIEAYQTETPDLQRLARRMCEKMRQESFVRGRGGKRTGLFYGRLNTRQCSRDDGKCFYRRKLPATDLDLAVSVLVDESGSMYWDDRITKARNAAIVLYEFCRTFEVPASVYGHTADNGYDLSLYAYAEFDSIDNQDRYRLMDMQARSFNRDGAAVSYMAQRLLARPEHMKLLLIPTDGLPYAKGYWGSEADKDLQETVKKYERLGLVIYALAMGDDCDRLREIYGSHFLDASDLNRLPQLMVKLVKENIKEC